MLNYICTCCGRKTPATTREPVCSCGGLFELDYKPPKWDDEKIDRKEWSIKTFTSVGTIGFYGACLADEAARR